MGTSLSGLTPATTFDGLLKVGDNDPLTADLKPISTGDGTDTMLELSTSALQIGGATGMYWDNTNKRLGIGTDVPSYSLQNEGVTKTQGIALSSVGHTSVGNNEIVSRGSLKLSLKNSGGVYERGINITAGGVSITGDDSTTPSSTMAYIKGSGATSATTSLLVQNSSGTELLRVRDDTVVSAATFYSTVSRLSYINTITNSYTVMQSHLTDGNASFYQSVAVGQTTTPTARLHLKGSGNDNTTTSLLVQNSDAENIMAITDDGYLTYRTPQRELLTLGNGSVLKYGTNSSFSALYNRASIYDGTNTTQFENGNVGIGNGTTTPTARLQVKGSGATSATTALLVQNSAGTDMLKVQDDSSLLMYRASNGAELLKIGESGGNAILYANGNSNRSLVLGYQNTLTAFNQTEFKTYNGTGYSEAMVITGNSNTSQFVGIGETTPTAKLQVKGSGNDATTTALLVQNSDGTDMLSVKDDLSVVFNSTITSASSTLRFDVGGVGTIRMNSDKVAIGGNTTPTARLHVKGSGATSATTALLVENSAGTELLKVVDDGQLEIKSNSGRVSTTSGTSIFSYSSGGGGVLDVNPSNNNSVKFRARGDNDTFLIQTNPAGDNVGIGASSPDSTAKLQVDSTTQGFLPPRMTDAERDAITTPAAGLMVYNTTTNKAQCYNGTAWQDLF